MSDLIESQSDDRTANNVVRHTYRVLTEEEKAQMLAIKDAGAAFIALCAQVGQSAELTLATRSAQVAVFWAVNHITK